MELVNSGISGLMVTLSLEDLVEYSRDLISQTKAELLPIAVSAAKECLMSKQEVMERFSICHTTLWNWEKKNKLIPVRIGRKVSYRQADIERLIIERGK